ncbi:MAG TPA: hypothetical protein VFX09_08840 [Burkholderiales bacterium]|nr:hypothetical protein [Burkholderiales bacterium]
MHRDVESLLSRSARSRLPFARQVALYLDPFSLFKDASRGAALEKHRARAYNRALRWVLLPYMRRWLFIAACCFLCIAPTEALAAQAPFFILPAAAFGMAFAIAVAVVACAGAVYLLLGDRG